MPPTPHLYLKPPWPPGRVPLSGEAARHLRVVLRMDPGRRVTYTDGCGTLGSGTLEEGFVLRGDEHGSARPVPAVRVAVAPPRSVPRQRFIVEKLSELGVDRLIWLTTRRSGGRAPRPEKSKAWAAAALEQSRGAWLIDVGGPMPLADLLRAAASGAGAGARGELWVAEPGGRVLDPARVSGMVAGVESVTVAVGPEGGWDPKEVPAGTERCGLGPTVLRTETAVVAAAVLLLGATRWPGGPEVEVARRR